MASKEFIQKRLEGAEKNVAKLEKKLERIRKVEAQGWEDPNPYMYSEYDLDRCLSDLNVAKSNLASYKEALAVILEKENSKKVQVIIDFLEAWRQSADDFYRPILTEYFERRDRIYAEREADLKASNSYEDYKKYDAKFCEAMEELRNELNGFFEYRIFEDLRGRAVRKKVKVKNGKYEAARQFVERNLNDSLEMMENELKREAERKYDDIVDRSNKVVGEITDASGLEIDARCNLNGYLVGTKARAKVQTIGAGGYAVQCFHFRTLITKI